jgi:hypothetical protein
MAEVTYIDPPSGWKYGFPKVLPRNVVDVKKWLIEQGYPQSEIDSCDEHFHYRSWNQEENVDEQRL